MRWSMHLRAGRGRSTVPPMDREEIRVEVAYALPTAQFLADVQVATNSQVESAIIASGVYERFPDADLRACPVGIWGRLVTRSHRLRDGDRVELYRPLRVDPMVARRERAAQD